MWVAMVLTSSGRSLHHAAAAPDSGCSGSGGGRVVMASKHRGCPRRRREAARMIQLKASLYHTAVHPTQHRRSLPRFTLHHHQSFRHLATVSFFAYIFRSSLLSEHE
jgi:hypothetical protein